MFRLERTGMKYDLTNITAMLKKLDNPHNKFKSIHIAGTNGKGATASFIASILMEHGLRTGLFTSPHIIRFNERIRVNGKCITDSYIKEFLNKNWSLIKKIRPSFFEVNTAMAFKYFADKKVDIAVVECGLGGRLDSTNVLRPELSVITQIGMDHMLYLGSTLRKIAFEKIGITKPGIVVVVSDNNRILKKIFKKKIKADNLFYLDDKVIINIIDSDLKGNRFSIKYNSAKQIFNIPLPGKFQVRNAAAAIYSSKKYLEQNAIVPEIKNILNGLSNVRVNSGYRCRLETFKINNIEIILDISHNTDGIKETYNVLKNCKPDVVVFGMMDDKDLNSALKTVLKISRNLILTKADYKRAADPELLLNIARKYKTKYHSITATKSVNDAVKFMRNGFEGAERVLISGSFFVVSDAIRALKIKKYFK